MRQIVQRFLEAESPNLSLILKGYHEVHKSLKLHFSKVCYY